MGNIFAYRSTDPKLMKKADDPVGPQNNRWLLKLNKEADLTTKADSTETHVPGVFAAGYVKDKIFYDVIYNPKETPFLKKAKENGNKTENGKFMFIYQAFSSFKLWHNVDPVINNETLRSSFRSSWLR